MTSKEVKRIIEYGKYGLFINEKSMEITSTRRPQPYSCNIPS